MAADKKAEPVKASPGPSAPIGAPAVSGLETKKSKKAKKKKAAVQPGATASVPSEQKAVAPKPREGEWVLVGKGGKAAKAKVKAQPVAATKAPPPEAKSPRLRPPKSSAVVLTLQPAAVKRGCTYKEVLEKAGSGVELAALGITGGLRFKKASTGARILEVPGAASGPQADLLAAKLREILPEQEVRVSRPEKCADVRISGLDDSVTPERLVAAVAVAAECQPLQVRCGSVRDTARVTGSAVVHLPVAAAKRLADGRRLLVGLMSVQVRVLPPKQSRCYRCLGKGHASAECRSEVDLSGLCFRCGQKGHKAAACEATPHCVRCATAGKAADHLLDGRGCSGPGPSPKGGGKKKEAVGPAKAVSQAPGSSATVAASATPREEAMETAN